MVYMYNKYNGLIYGNFLYKYSEIHYGVLIIVVFLLQQKSLGISVTIM